MICNITPEAPHHSDVKVSHPKGCQDHAQSKDWQLSCPHGCCDGGLVCRIVCIADPWGKGQHDHKDGGVEDGEIGSNTDTVHDVVEVGNLHKQVARERDQFSV